MNADPTIYRIAQNGEALGVLRAVSTAVNSDRFGRSDYNFDFRVQEGKDRSNTWKLLLSKVHQHDMGLLACNFAARVVLAHGDSGGAAEFDYTPEMALRAWQQTDAVVENDKHSNEKLCTEEVRKEIRQTLCTNGQSAAFCAQ